MARISERLADRIDNAERRSAEAIEEVGDKVGEVSERLNQRYERAAAGLSERMRESEERLARVLEENARPLDARLAEAQRGPAGRHRPPRRAIRAHVTDALTAASWRTERGLAERVERTSTKSAAISPEPSRLVSATASAPCESLTPACPRRSAACRARRAYGGRGPP
jgi:hypothetical protein